MVILREGVLILVEVWKLSRRVLWPGAALIILIAACSSAAALDEREICDRYSNYPNTTFETGVEGNWTFSSLENASIGNITLPLLYVAVAKAEANNTTYYLVNRYGVADWEGYGQIELAWALQSNLHVRNHLIIVEADDVVVGLLGSSEFQCPLILLDESGEVMTCGEC